jgi:tetratricopeptide (TPR) repeat protein
LAACLLFLTVSFAPCGMAAAQDKGGDNVPPQAAGSTLDAIQARRKALFDKMMADPANLDVAFEYARLSSEAGDLESAISTLERMLVFAPDVPRLQLELGVLYFRLGSYQLAQSYLTEALAAPNVPAAVKARVDPYLKAIRERTRVDRFSGTVSFGTRYQTNANGGAAADIVYIGGIPLILNNAAKADPDVNAYASATFHYSHDLPSQGDRFDADLLTYGSLYSDHHEIDTALAELTFGPVLALDRFGLAHTDFGVYGILDGVSLEGDPYQLGGGVGISLATAFTPDTRGEMRVEYRHEDYYDSGLRPTASDRTGDDVLFLASLRHQFTNRLAVSGSFQAERDNARRAYQSNWLVGATLGLTYLMNPPVGDQSRPWIASLAFGALQRRYDQPDLVLMDYRRRDVETFVQGALTVPLSDSWAVQAVLGYRNVHSNFSLYTYDNVSASLGFIKSF